MALYPNQTVCSVVYAVQVERSIETAAASQVPQYQTCRATGTSLFSLSVGQVSL